MIDEKILKSEEKAIYALRALYKKYGYLPFKMNKFEEYELYLENKDFLVSNRIITFNDTTGKLLALKPDVTLSIIKNSEDRPGYKQKTVYNENVYRVSGRTGQYQEIMQTGLECIGDLDLYDIFEVLSLAAKSLGLIMPEFELDISHLGILSALLEEAGGDEAFRKKASSYIAEKNTHDLERLCKAAGIEPEKAARLTAVTGIYGERKTVLKKLLPLCDSRAAKAAWEELKALDALLSLSEFSERICYDFSIVNDMAYYNGIVFKGFLKGICEGVLAGGRYDKLMQKMGKKSGAIGFALYLDLLEENKAPSAALDVDTLLLYDAATPPEEVWQTVRQLTSENLSVSAQRAVPEKLRFRRILDLRKERA